MTQAASSKIVGYTGMTGGLLGILLTPIMVIIKYMTGWNIIPAPAWIEAVRDGLGDLLLFARPPELWTVYGSMYTLALLFMLIGFTALAGPIKNHRNRISSMGYWTMIAGLCMVIPGDAIHSWTWHQHGLTTPTPGTNPVANTAYAVHMMGMNLIIIGSLILGVTGLRRNLLAPWLAWALVLIFPSAVVASTTFLPTTPSGALWLFSMTMMACGFFLAAGKPNRLVMAAR